MTSEEQHTVLQVKDLAVGYFNKKNSTVISEGINFELQKGELIGLVGANGIGKSTLLRTLAAMQPKLSGTITLNGNDLSAYNSIELAGLLSVVLTEAQASRNLSVLELVSLGRQPHTNWLGTLSDNDKIVIREALKSTETTSLSHRKCFELSDGQLQRVIIARALAQDTPLILLDEPTTHLDLYHRAYIVKLLKKLSNETGKTILFSTHEIDLAIQLANKMIVMTPERTYFGSPCSLIEAGRFDALFPSETIDFDGKTGKFGIKE